MLAHAVKQFFTLRPSRDYTISSKRAAIAATAVVLSQLADFGSTWLGFQFGAAEGNGLMASIIHDYGFIGFLGVKLLGAAALVYLTWRRRVTPWVIVGIYSAIVVWNLSVSFTLFSLA